MRPYFEQGGVTIYLADCREVLPTVGPVDLVLTDPPYGISLENHGIGDGKRRNRSWLVIGDSTQSAGQDVLTFCEHIGWPTIAFASPMHPWSGEWKQHLVWDKGFVGLGGDPDTYWLLSWELIQVARTGKLQGKREPSVLRYHVRPADFTDHPCQKPVGLLAYLTRKTTNASALVCDPFMGSGSTLVAAKMLGRRAIGIEISEAYAEIAARRLSQQVLPLEVAP